MKNEAEKERLITGDFLLLALINALVGTCSVMLMTTVLLYGKHMGFSNSTSGLLTAMFAVFALIGRPFSGVLADKISRKKLLLISGIVFAAAPLMFIFTTSLPMHFIGRAIQGLAMSLSTTTCSAISTDIIPKTRFTEGVGYFGIGISISTAVSPAIGLWLINAFGYSGMFVGAAVMGAIALVCSVAVKYRQSEPQVRAKHGAGILLKGMVEKKAVSPAVIQFITSFSMICISQLLPMFALAKGNANIGSFYLISAAGVLVPKIFGAWLVRALGNKGMAVCGFLLMMASYLGLQTVTLSPLAIFVLAIVYGVGQSAAQMSLQTAAVINVKSSRRGAANATYLLASDLSFAVSPIFWGGYQDRFGVGSIFWVASGAIAVCIIMAVTSAKNIFKVNCDG